MKYLKTFESNNLSLISAIDHNNIKRVKEILEKNENNIIYDDFSSGDFIARACGYEDNTILNLLINAGADINIPRSRNNKTGLYIATELMFPEKMKILIDAGADLDIRCTKNLKSALLTTINWGKFSDETHMLIKAGANWNIVDVDGDDMMEYLFRKQKQTIIDMYPKEYELYLKRKKIRKFNL